MNEEKKLEIRYSKEAITFLSKLPDDVKKKIKYNIDKVAIGIIDNTVFKKIEKTEIWEFRILYKGIAYRILSFWDTTNNKLIIAANGFIKKTQKTPTKEIKKAEDIRKRYFQIIKNKRL